MQGKKLHGVGVRDVVVMHFDVFNQAAILLQKRLDEIDQNK